MTGDLLDLMGDRGRMPKDVAASPEQSRPIKTEMIELDMVLHYDNEARGELFASIDGDEAKAVWLPKAEIQFTRSGKTVAAVTTQGKPLANGLPGIAVNIPEWLAKEKGLI